MTLIHKFSQFDNFLFLCHFSGFTGGLEVTNALAFSVDVHGALVKEKLGILLLNFIDVRHICHYVPTVVHIALAFDLGRCIATRFELFLDNSKHSFFCFIQSLL